MRQPPPLEADQWQEGHGVARRGRVLIIVQNLPVPFDRRVWLESRTLVGAGYEVVVVCPKGPSDPGHSVLEGVELYKYSPFAPGRGAISFVVEYLYSFAATLILSLKASRRGRFDVVQSCNPPDIFWPIGLLFRLLHGSRFVFDHHDLCPELYMTRFDEGSRLTLGALHLLERKSIGSADEVITTNDSYRRIAIERDSADPCRTTVVRNGPDLTRLAPGPVDLELKRGREHLVAYLGVMGPQDGVDIVLKVANLVVKEHRRDDVAFTLIGAGDSFRALRALSVELGLDGAVEFTGRLPDAEVAAILSAADVGISPDPKNALNDLSTMNKTMEYMAFGLPVAAFDLVETRFSAGFAAMYAKPNSVEDLAAIVLKLIDDKALRREMGSFAVERVRKQLAWSHQASRYLEVYERLIPVS